MNNRSNITLIGMPACGKSTLGVLLAKARGMMFVDTDLLLQQRHGQLLREIIDAQGIEAFKRMEAQVILALDCKNACIATGGSVVYSEEAMRHLKRLSTVVFIDLPCEVVERRIADIKSRGVVIEEGKTLPELFRERRPLYLQYADIAVDARSKGVEALLTEIIEMIEKEACNR